MTRPDILEDLYRAIEEFTEQLETADKVSDLRFGNVIQLADELKAGKRYSETEEEYTIWLNWDGDDTRLIRGREPVYPGGISDGSCDRLLHTFTAVSYEEAEKKFDRWNLINIHIFPK